MKKKVLKAMKNAAKTLQETGHKVMERVSGLELLKLNPEAKDHEGNPIVSSKWYKREKMVATSNFRKVKKYFKKPENKKQLTKLVRP